MTIIIVTGLVVLTLAVVAWAFIDQRRVYREQQEQTRRLERWSHNIPTGEGVEDE